MVESDNSKEEEGTFEERLKKMTTQAACKVNDVIIPFEQTDDYRDPQASSSGGFRLDDQAIISKHRSVIGEMVAVSSPFVDFFDHIRSLSQ